MLHAKDAHAWGERGHQLVTRVAARLVMQSSGAGDKLAPAFVQKELMLAHLANVPDTVWRGLGKDIERANAPTHYIDLEYIDPKPAWDSLPKDKASAAKALAALCAAPRDGYVCPDTESKDEPPQIEAAGTAPWRVAQLHALALESLRGVARTGGGVDDAAVDRALLHLGLLSHFIGDLAQPLHTTRDYDGWERGAGGLHSYFETDVVNAFELSLEQDVWRSATTAKHLDRVLARIPAKDRAALAKTPDAAAFALALDSFARLPDLFAADERHARTKPSSREKGLKLKAERRAAAATKGRFHALAVERLATGAQVLAHLWLRAWEDAGRPDLSGYKSWAYPMAPEFIAPP